MNSLAPAVPVLTPGSSLDAPILFPRPDIIRIPDEALEEIRTLEALMKQQAFLLRALERDLAHTVASACAINLDTESWDLDTRHGLVVRNEQTPVSQVPSVSQE